MNDCPKCRSENVLVVYESVANSSIEEHKYTRKTCLDCGHYWNEYKEEN